MSTQPSASAKRSWPYFRSSAEDRRKRRKAQDQKKRRRVEPLGKIKILAEVKGETYDRSSLPPTQGMSCVWLAMIEARRVGAAASPRSRLGGRPSGPAYCAH